MVKAKIDFEGYPLSSETIQNLKFESGPLCNGTSLDHNIVVEEALMKFKNAL